MQLIFNCLGICLLVITLQSLEEITAFPTDIHHLKRGNRVFKYVPLNSMTLSSRKQPPKKSAEDTTEEEATPENDNEGRNKRPWWESLPSNKNQKNKNKVILDEYDKLKSSIPKWPWMSALKEGSGNSNPLTRKKTNRDKVRVVMTTEKMPKQTETTMKPLIMSSAEMEEDNMVPQTTVTSQDNELPMIKVEMEKMTMMKEDLDERLVGFPEMTTTKKPEDLPDWLEAFNTKTTTKKPIDWFASWNPSTTTDNPFKYKINSGKDVLGSFPVIEVNGPPIKLPSFSVSSNFKVFSENDKNNKMQMYSDIEQRTGSSNDEILEDDDFDLKFFPQRQDEDDSDEKFTLLAHEPMLGDLETTTTQRPLVTQSLSPIENREALSQLVSLYEQAPSSPLLVLKGETDKTQMKDMEMDKTKEIMEDDYKIEEMIMEESKKDVQMYHHFDHPINHGIPPSITLQLAASKSKIPQKSKMPISGLPTSTTLSSTSPSISLSHNGIQQLTNNLKAEQKMGVMNETPQQREIKSTLKKLLEGNNDMMRSVQAQLAQQTKLLETLMKLL